MRQPLIFYPGDTYSNADELLNVVLSYQQNFVSHQGNNNAKPDQIFFRKPFGNLCIYFFTLFACKAKICSEKEFLLWIFF